MTALHHAVARHDRDAVELLLKSGARSDVVAHRQRTPRQWADPVRDGKIVEMLSEADG